MPNLSKSLRQYSLRTVLLLIALSAAGLTVWKTFFWEPPTHKIALYEKAQMYHGTTATIGPNQIRIESVARNHRDGSITIENGRGKHFDETVELGVPNRQRIADAAAWLDVAQIELWPGVDLIRIIEVRVFDHNTRELLSVDHPRCGYRHVEPNIIQLYGLGQVLPGEIDLWLRVSSYRPEDQVARLLPTLTASVDVAGVTNGSLKIAAMQNGYVGWSSVDGFLPVEGDHHYECAVEFEFTATSPRTSNTWYEVTAITKDAQRLTADQHVGTSGNGPLTFHCQLEDINHFDVRPAGEGHVFFFEKLQLPPSAQTAKFAAPPVAVLKIDGQPMPMSPIIEFQPLLIRAAIRDGRAYSGSVSSTNGLHLIPCKNGPEEVGKMYTRVIDSHGIGDPPLSFRTQMTGNQTWLADSAFKYRSGHRASISTRSSEAKSFQSPLKDIHAIEVQLLPVVGN